MSQTLEKTKTSKHEARRRASEQALVRAALDLAEEKGVGAATFSAIGERSGYSRGLASQHFGSKRGLIAAVIEHLHDQMQHNVSDAVENDSMSGLEGLEFYIEAYFAAYRGSNTYRAYFTFLSGAVAERSELLNLFAQSHERVKAQISGLIDRGRADGSILSQADAGEGGLIIGSLLMGVSMQALIDPELDLFAMERQAKSMVASRYSAG